MTKCFRCEQAFEESQLFVWYGPPARVEVPNEAPGEARFESSRRPICRACRTILLDDEALHWIWIYGP